MMLRRAGREFLYYGFTGLPTNPPTPQVEVGAELYDLAWWDGTADDPVFVEVVADLGLAMADIESGRSRVARALFAGPDATGNPDGTIVLTERRTVAEPRLTDSDEVVIRDGAPIYLT